MRLVVDARRFVLELIDELQTGQHEQLLETGALGLIGVVVRQRLNVDRFGSAVTARFLRAAHAPFRRIPVRLTPEERQSGGLAAKAQTSAAPVSRGYLGAVNVGDPFPDLKVSMPIPQARLLPGERHLSPEDQVAILAIRADIMAAGAAFRERHRWVAAHQDAIGMAIFFVGALGSAALGVAYLTGVLSAWVTIPATAVLLSLLHELEHDLIHSMYFRNRKLPHNLMLAGLWLLRPSTVNPWTRRRMHLHHHRASGTESDLEEQAITNGERWGLRRLLMTGDGHLAAVLRPFRVRRHLIDFVAAQRPRDDRERKALMREQLLAYLPLGTIHYLSWHTWLVAHGAALVFGAPTGAWGGALHVLDAAVVVWFAPNVLRTFCLHFVSSNMHYFGDVEHGNVVQQVQVWTAWWLAPLHLFCFNFGSTHAIHHFWIGDPFYVRQAIAKQGHATMLEHGVRFNDFGTFRRANRRGEYRPAM